MFSSDLHKDSVIVRKVWGGRWKEESSEFTPTITWKSNVLSNIILHCAYEDKAQIMFVKGFHCS